jgi:rhomboid protease GluP
MPATTWRELRGSRAFPTATVAVLALTVALTLLQIAVPEIRLDLWRDQGALESGQLWRLATPLLIQFDPWFIAILVFVLIAFIGTAVERVYGSARWLVIYATCGIVGQAFGYLWEPPDAGASVAGAGLLGAMCAWLLAPSSEAPLPPRAFAALVVLGGLVITVVDDMHGPPLLLGCALGALMRARVAEPRRTRANP